LQGEKVTNMGVRFFRFDVNKSTCTNGRWTVHYRPFNADSCDAKANRDMAEDRSTIQNGE
jgi:hypothetical protein